MQGHFVQHYITMLTPIHSFHTFWFGLSNHTLPFPVEAIARWPWWDTTNQWPESCKRLWITVWINNRFQLDSVNYNKNRFSRAFGSKHYIMFWNVLLLHALSTLSTNSTIFLQWGSQPPTPDDTLVIPRYDVLLLPGKDVFAAHPCNKM